MEENLLRCSRFVSEPSNHSLLASMLNIPDDEVESIYSTCAVLESTEPTKETGTNSSTKINATNFLAAAKRLVTTISSVGNVILQSRVN